MQAKRNSVLRLTVVKPTSSDWGFGTKGGSTDISDNYWDS